MDESQVKKKMINPIFDRNKVNLVLQTALDAHGARQRAIVNNIANVDTPGYQRIEVSFDESLKKAASRIMSNDATQGGFDSEDLIADIQSCKPIVRIDTTTPLRADGSNVSIDREMAELAKNGSRINAMTELLIRNYQNIKAAINGR